MLLCERQIFSCLEDSRRLTRDKINQLTLNLESTLHKYWNFICVGFLGHVFNQESTPLNELDKFHIKWQRTIHTVAMYAWKNHDAADYVADTSMTYILGYLARMQRSSKSTKKSIKVLCAQLEKFWLKKATTLPVNKHKTVN